MAARKAPSGTSGVPVTRSGRQPSTIGTPRLRATSARCEPAAPVRAMTPRAANSSGASAGTGWSDQQDGVAAVAGRVLVRLDGHQPAGGRPRCPRPSRHVLAAAQHGGREQRHRRARGGQPGRARGPSRPRPLSPAHRFGPAHRLPRLPGPRPAVPPRRPVRHGARALGLQQPDPVVIGGPLDHVIAQQPPGPPGQGRDGGDHRLSDQRREPVVTALVRAPAGRAGPAGRVGPSRGNGHPAAVRRREGPAGSRTMRMHPRPSRTAGRRDGRAPPPS